MVVAGILAAILAAVVLCAAAGSSCVSSALKSALRSQLDAQAFVVHLQEPRLRVRVSGWTFAVPTVENVLMRAVLAGVPLIARQLWSRVKLAQERQAKAVKVTQAQQWGMHVVRSRAEELEEEGAKPRAYESRAARETVLALASAGLLDAHLAWFSARNLPPVIPSSHDLPPKDPSDRRKTF